MKCLYWEIPIRLVYREGVPIYSGVLPHHVSTGSGVWLEQYHQRDHPRTPDGVGLIEFTLTFVVVLTIMLNNPL